MPIPMIILICPSPWLDTSMTRSCWNAGFCSTDTVALALEARVSVLDVSRPFPTQTTIQFSCLLFKEFSISAGFRASPFDMESYRIFLLTRSLSRLRAITWIFGVGDWSDSSRRKAFPNKPVVPMMIMLLLLVIISGFCRKIFVGSFVR